ncbi:MAG: hypothetical protein QM499_08485 [Flavobacteriaceae bacterium]
MWLIVSAIKINRSTNHLINYSIESETISLVYYVSIKSKKEVIIPISDVKFTKLQTRIFDFGFDVLSIKYIDNEGLHNLLDLKISNKKDWIDILSKIELEAT